MIKLKIGDNVRVVSGKDRGRKGKIEKIFPKNSTALVPGVNIYKKHVKGVQGRKGGIYDIPRPLSFAKLTLVCPKCKKISRVGFKSIQGSKLRVCKKCGREIDSK